MNAMADSNPKLHNYYPPWVQLPGYVTNRSSVISLITQFGFLWAAVIGVSFFVIGRLRPKVGLSDRIAFTWMCLSISSLAPGAAAEKTAF
jgi:cholestenol delta-isomerase